MNSLQKVIKLTKENLDKIEGQFLNLQHPPSIFFEVGDNFNGPFASRILLGIYLNRAKPEACLKYFKFQQRF